MGASERKRARTYHFLCQRCGKEYEATNRRQLYCSEYCRRQYQNETRKAQRAELADCIKYEAKPWDYDPWERNDLDNLENIFANALTDGWTGTPCGLTMCPDEAVAGATACLHCERYKGEANDRPFLYGQNLPHDAPPEDDAHGEDLPEVVGEDKPSGAVKLPRRKEVAKALRRLRKRNRS